MAEQLILGWPEVLVLATKLAERWRGEPLNGVYGVPRGGVPVALMVSQLLGVPVVDAPGDGVLSVDDLIDSGATMARVGGPFDALLRKPHSPAMPITPTLDAWVVFPWEVGTQDASGPADAVVRLLEHIGEDPTRDGLLETPQRVLKALTEMTAGYSIDPAEVLAKTFDVGPADELVVVREIPFHSMCEHHLLSFSGNATVGYLPKDRVVGLSKLARLVDLYARRLQVQERMTHQIADAITEHLGTETAGVVIRARHSCMACRGIQKSAEMVTSKLTGRLRDDPAARAEFLALARA